MRAAGEFAAHAARLVRVQGEPRERMIEANGARTCGTRTSRTLDIFASAALIPTLMSAPIYRQADATGQARPFSAEPELSAARTHVAHRYRVGMLRKPEAVALRCPRYP